MPKTTNRTTQGREKPILDNGDFKDYLRVSTKKLHDYAFVATSLREARIIHTILEDRYKSILRRRQITQEA